ncbi:MULTISPECIES: FAD-dependent oxidoreductase [unclassified Polaromonas]|uniref:FAD-dependent oxidoreductase n=1 Tax=unclassified Polaromonas TaxID=2638319 RepID=UPI0018C9F5AE|nr:MULTISPECIES: FAD-dependent oxidoreductase [unclassified Polaromonas]MBG6071371.1 rubredoxin-NAD+ reductase [Polaromonas sp. CG_9.7]MBG6113371.1 rubredoxin-NAD+ reductase [Polaromonas sp. CG_9.2]MDH6183171.1 rubredoxin-NAD+ reductase [Polaromonas sp. CG_23.6]
MTNTVVVIGAGLAGWTTVREFRKLDSTTPVTLITGDSGDFYAKPSLSNAFAQGRLPAQLVSTPAARMAETLGVTLLAHTRVQALDTAAQSVMTPAGSIAFRDLVLATGAQPIRVPVEGDAADRVLSVNSLDDFAVLHAQLQAGSGRPVLIMGAGLIGCEFANDLASAGFCVSVVDPGLRPLAALLPEAASAELRQALEALGVTFHFGTTVRRVDATQNAENLQVLLSNGLLAQADCVLSAIGLRADTRLAQAAGLAVERGIMVNRQLRTSAAHVHALGDCAQYAHGVTLPYVMPIMTAARALAATLAGTPSDAVFALMPVSVKTPALPLVAAPPSPGTAGQWHAPEAGLWQWLDEAGVQRGFVLSGSRTAQRMAESKRVVL